LDNFWQTNKIALALLKNLKTWELDKFYGRLGALEWAWHHAEINLRSLWTSRICIPTFWVYLLHTLRRILCTILPYE